ncbi:MAG: hypothetical protein Q6363_001240 [Candidatus Njordarchaeota archaeon]
MQEYNFKILEISCGSAKEAVNVNRTGAWLVVSGVLNVPDPCYTLKFFPEYDKENNVLKINIKAYKFKVFCIKCLAKAKFQMMFNIMHLRNKFESSKIKIQINYYVRGKTAEFINEEIEI